MNNNQENSEKRCVTQGVGAVSPEAFKIGASTPYDPVTLCYTSLIV